MSGINGIDFMVLGTMHLLSVAAASSLTAPAAHSFCRPTRECMQLSVIDARKITRHQEVKWNPWLCELWEENPQSQHSAVLRPRGIRLWQVIMAHATGLTTEKGQLSHLHARQLKKESKEQQQQQKKKNTSHLFFSPPITPAGTCSITSRK